MGGPLLLSATPQLADSLNGSGVTGTVSIRKIAASSSSKIGQKALPLPHNELGAPKLELNWKTIYTK